MRHRKCLGEGERCCHEMRFESVHDMVDVSKFVGGQGSVPCPAWGANSALPGPLVGFGEMIGEGRIERAKRKKSGRGMKGSKAVEGRRGNGN